MSDDEHPVYWAPTIITALLLGSLALPYGAGPALVASVGGAFIGQGIAEMIVNHERRRLES